MDVVVSHTPENVSACNVARRQVPLNQWWDILRYHQYRLRPKVSLPPLSGVSPLSAWVSLVRLRVFCVCVFFVCCGHNAGAVCVLLFVIAEDGKKVRGSDQKTVPTYQCGLPKTHSFWVSE